MFFIYQTFIAILLIFSPIVIIFRIFKNKEDKKRFKEKFSFPTKKRKNGKLIWFHGASVGEIMSIVPLIKNYENNQSISQILITSSTLSSSKIIKKFKFKKTIHQFYPLDYFIFKNIPLILLNARLTKKTYERWMKIKYFSKSIFNKITVIYPQNLETKYFLRNLFSKKINLIGNLKFAENNNDNLDKFNFKIKKEIKNKKVWIASSTHQNEEIFCAKTHIELKKKFKNLLTIIIPRHIHRSKEIVKEIKSHGLNCACHSSNKKNLKNVDIYIVDTFGETKKFHKIGSSVFLGGSIINRGGQNPLEAARFGAKIFHGPNIDNFKDVYKLLKKLKISKKIKTPKELASSIFFKKNKRLGLKIKNIGEKILKKTIKELDYLINNEFKKT